MCFVVFVSWANSKQECDQFLCACVCVCLCTQYDDRSASRGQSRCECHERALLSQQKSIVSKSYRCWLGSQTKRLCVHHSTWRHCCGRTIFDWRFTFWPYLKPCPWTFRYICSYSFAFALLSFRPSFRQAPDHPTFTAFAMQTSDPTWKKRNVLNLQDEVCFFPPSSLLPPFPLSPFFLLLLVREDRWARCS